MMGSLHNLTRDFSECPTIHFKVFTQMLTNNMQFQGHIYAKSIHETNPLGFE